MKCLLKVMASTATIGRNSIPIAGFCVTPCSPLLWSIFSNGYDKTEEGCWFFTSQYRCLASNQLHKSDCIIYSVPKYLCTWSICVSADENHKGLFHTNEYTLVAHCDPILRIGRPKRYAPQFNSIHKTWYDSNPAENMNSATSSYDCLLVFPIKL